MGPDEGVSEWTAEQNERLLSTLRWNWGDAYEITLEDGLWKARRRDNSKHVLEARSADGLRQEIFIDYTAKPVPRDLGIEMP